MCGFAGLWDHSSQQSAAELRENATVMAEKLRHRGPNDRGVWVDPETGVALGFRRLSIIDLSPEGSQPMTSSSGRFVIVFNGEIYNFIELRRELEARSAPTFRGHSDTEVVLAAIEQFGIDGAIRRFVGMFAFALWDRRERQLVLVRDRLGEKPLYYGWVGSTLLFGSELKALRVHASFRGTIDREALADFMRFGYISAPATIYREFRKLPQGSMLRFDLSSTGSMPAPTEYWSVREVAEAGLGSRFKGTEADAADRLEELLTDSVRRQMIADVPLGAFLSGGIDSSAIVALMQAQSVRPVRTFTIGFDEANFDEAPFAQKVAQYLGTEHTELYIAPSEAQQVVGRLAGFYDEPFADPSGIPCIMLSELAAQHVTVCLSGDGGDELFAGYSWYSWSRKAWNRVRWCPGLMRGVSSRLLGGIPVQGWNRVFDVLGPILPALLRTSHPGARIHNLARLLAQSNSMEDIHRLSQTAWEEEVILEGNPSRPTRDRSVASSRHDEDPIRRMMARDMTTYLPDDILVKVDRASMGVGLEVRAPFLDHRVVEFAWSLPTEMNLHGGKTKRLLRRLLYRHVPRELIDRPKSGFCVPIGSWIRGPLRPWAESLLDERKLRLDGIFNPRFVRQTWDEHQTGICDRSQHLWNILMFRAFQESQMLH